MKVKTVIFGWCWWLAVCGVMLIPVIISVSGVSTPTATVGYSAYSSEGPLPTGASGTVTGAPFIAEIVGPSETVSTTEGVKDAEATSESELAASPSSVPSSERTGKSIDFEGEGSIRSREESTGSSDPGTADILSSSTEGPSERKDVENASSDSTDYNAKQAVEDSHEIKEVSGGDAPPSKPKKEMPAWPVVRVEPRFLYVSSTKAPANERDGFIQSIFGGECTFEIWNRCNRIKFWGGDYLVPDKQNPGEMIVKHHRISCVSKTEKTLCLKNGWTVARCHMLCMSQCNVDFRMNYDELVLHEGDCRMPILGKK